MYLHEADICLKDAIKENPDDVDLKVLLKVRNEMCHELESNECTTPKDNMDRSKEAANANGNLEGDMLSFTQMYGTPTELIRLSDQVMRSRESDQQMLFDGPSFDLNFTQSPATKGKVLAGPKYEEEIDELHKIVNDLQNYDSQHTTTSESSEFKTPMSNLASVSGTDTNSSSILSIKKREPKTLNAIIPNIVGGIGKCHTIPPDVLESPYTRIECSVDDGITYSEKWVADCIFTGRFTPTDIIFKTNTETHSLEVQRSVFESLYPGIRIASGAIDVFTHVLNYAEKFCDRKSLRRVFCNTSMVSEKQFMVKDCYGQMPRVLTKLFEDYLSFEKHHREGEMKFPEYKILRMGCRTMKNFIDYGVFAMRHMETYKGERHYGHICGLRTEGKAHNFLLNDLRYKYVSKMLLCEINMKKEEVEIETEAYKSLSIREKRRLSADASATLMERMEKMF
ncbi:hypothetical protein Tco_1270695 [Tanacetum coccineum]